ncbi:hypothetical protein X890_2881 [Burkholderia pseudomallei MSHR4299]|nr:hypothetical protein X890_2881 [Burkholderia pseudomallei MSHR4299]
MAATFIKHQFLREFPLHLQNPVFQYRRLLSNTAWYTGETEAWLFDYEQCVALLNRPRLGASS